MSVLLGLRGHDHARGPDDLLAQAIAGLVDLDDRAARRRRPGAGGRWPSPRAARGRTVRRRARTTRSPTARARRPVPSARAARPRSNGSSWSAPSSARSRLSSAGSSSLRELRDAALLCEHATRGRRACGSSRSRPGCAAPARGTGRARRPASPELVEIAPRTSRRPRGSSSAAAAPPARLLRTRRVLPGARRRSAPRPSARVAHAT